MYKLVYMIATRFQRLYPYCRGPFNVLAYKFTRPSLNRPRCRGIGGTLSMLQTVSVLAGALLHSSCLTTNTWAKPLAFRCYHACELRNTLFSMHFRFIAAILIPTYPESDSIRTSPVMLLDSENMGIVHWTFIAITHTKTQIT